MVSLIWFQIILFILINRSLGGPEDGYEEWQVEMRPNQEFEVSRGVIDDKKDIWDFTMPEKYSSASSISTAPAKVKKSKKKKQPTRKHARTNTTKPKMIKKKIKNIKKTKKLAHNSSSRLEKDKKPLDIIVHITMKK